MKLRSQLYFIILALMGTSNPAKSQQSLYEMSWQEASFSIGAAALVFPDFQGADKLTLGAVPIIGFQNYQG